MPFRGTYLFILRGLGCLTGWLTVLGVVCQGGRSQCLSSSPSLYQGSPHLARDTAREILSPFTTHQENYPSAAVPRACARLGVECRWSLDAARATEHRREEIKKEIVSSRCFKLPFITTHKPDPGARRELPPAAILSHPWPMPATKERRVGAWGNRLERVESIYPASFTFHPFLPPLPFSLFPFRFFVWLLFSSRFSSTVRQSYAPSLRVPFVEG